jgi:hypothetical protein
MQRVGGLAMFIPGSVFIMDVSKSSSMKKPSTLTNYLQETVEWMNEISRLNPNRISLIHRFGDEVLLVARGFVTSYLIAFYIRATWAFQDNPPYFGIGFGDLGSILPQSEDLERWNSPVIKQARRCVDTLKSTKIPYRPFILFDQDETLYKSVNRVLNEYVQIQDRFFKLQTHPDHVASALYVISDFQEWIAVTTGKNRSTISRQIHKSNIDLILTLKERVLKVLCELEISLGMQLSSTVHDSDHPDTLLTIPDEISDSQSPENRTNAKQGFLNSVDTFESGALDQQIKKQLMLRVEKIRNRMLELNK